LRGALAIAGTAAAAYGLARGVNAYLDGREPANVRRVAEEGVEMIQMRRARLGRGTEERKEGGVDEADMPPQMPDWWMQEMQGNIDATIQNDPVRHATGGRRVASGSAQTINTSARQTGVAAASLVAAAQNLQSTQLSRALAVTDVGGNQPGLIGTPQAQAATDMRSVLDMAESQTLRTPARVIPNSMTPGNQVAGGQGDANPFTAGSLNGVRGRPSTPPSVGTPAPKRSRIDQDPVAMNTDGTVRRQEGDQSGVPQTQLLPVAVPIRPMRPMTRAEAAANPARAALEALQVAEARDKFGLEIQMQGGSPNRPAKALLGETGEFLAGVDLSMLPPESRAELLAALQEIKNSLKPGRK